MKYLVIVTLFALICAVSSLRSHPDVIAPQLSAGKAAGLTHHLAKRQTTLTIQDIVDCTTLMSDYQCGSSGYAQQIADIALGCRNDTYARNLANTCARSENGDFCGSALLRFSFDQSLTEGEAACSSAVTLGSCPSTCLSFLQSASSRLGCCVNTYINTTDSPLLSLYSTYVDYRLWNLCNVPLPATDCGNGLPLNPPQDAAQNCTVQELFRRFANYECMTSVGQPLVDALLRNSRCYIYARIIVDLCATNNVDNQFCAVAVASNVITSGTSSDPLFASLIANCDVSSSSFCSSSCQSAVSNITDDYGCCVNVFNNSDHSGLQLPQLSYGVWQSCGVDTPGFCTGASTLSGASTMKAFAWMIAIAMAIYMAVCI